MSPSLCAAAAVSFAETRSRLTAPLRSTLAAVALAMALTAPLGAATLSSVDNVFNDADWTLYATPLTPPGSTEIASQVTVDSAYVGVPYRKTRLVFANVGGNNIIVAAHLRSGWSVDPSASCGIVTIGGTYVADAITNNQTNLGLVLRQAGRFYTRNGGTLGPPNTVPGQFTPYTVSASGASGFTSVDNSLPLHPDFSRTSTDPIEFGYYTRTSTSSATPATVESGIDSLSITVTTQTFTLTLIRAGNGSVMKSLDLPAYECGTTVTLCANAAMENTFTGWSGDASGASPTTTVTLDDNKSVTANFAPSPGAYCDGGMADADWTLTKVFDTLGTGTASAHQDSSGGNICSFREETHTWSSSDTQVGLIRIANVSNRILFHPANGGIATLGYSWDLKSFSAGAVRYGLLLVQDGNYYVHNGDLTSNLQDWTHHDHPGLTALNLTKFNPADGSIDTTQHPDLSDTTKPIQLGYLISNSLLTPAHSGTIVSGIDNWCVTTTGVTGVGESEPRATETLRLAPNPFTSSLTIHLAIPAAGRVRVEIFDVLGRHVRTLADGSLPAGARDLVWDGTTDSGRAARAGLYFAHVRAPASEMTRSALLVR